MVICNWCQQDMASKVGCTVELFTGFYSGEVHLRIKYGDETRRKTIPSSCSDCAAPLGSFHHPGCDVERCPQCKRQAISCECVIDEDDEDEDFGMQTLAGPVDWCPLEQFFGSDTAPELDAFMFMGHVLDPVWGAIREYKHRDTRRYLHIDVEGVTYKYLTYAHAPIDRQEALELVYEGIEELYLSSPGSLPRREIFACHRNRPALGLVQDVHRP